MECMLNSPDKEYFVYKHTSPNGKSYIGVTRQNPPSKRWANGKGYDYNTYFYRAIQKYGWDNFKHEILFKNLTSKEAEKKERELIAYYKSADRKFGYNIELGGNGVGKMSEETKKKISKSHIGVNSVPVVKYSINGEFLEEYFGVIEAARQNGLWYEAISACCRGVSKTAGGFIWRYKSDDITKEYVKWCNTNEYLESKKNPIKQYSMTGELISEYESAEEAARNVKGSIAPSIRKCCNYVSKNHCGYIWQYSKVVLTEDIIVWCNSNLLFTPVKQYSLNGIFVREYKSLKEAAKSINVKLQDIWDCCNNRRKTVGGYIWRYSTDIVTDEHIKWCNNKKHTKAKDVFQYTIDGNFIKKWDSIYQIYKELNFCKSSIRQCCKGKRKNAYGYMWRHSLV